MVVGVLQAVVVDASISATWLLPDESTPQTEAALDATATNDVWFPRCDHWRCATCYSAHRDSLGRAYNRTEFMTRTAGPALQRTAADRRARRPDPRRARRAQSSGLIVRRFSTARTCSVPRAIETALSIWSWLLAVPVSQTVPLASVST